MSLPETTLTQLQDLMRKNSTLLAQVQAADDAAHIAAIIAQAAAQSGITVTHSELVAHFEQEARDAATPLLSDAQLDAIAGGMNRDEFIAMSVFTLGWGCFGVSMEKRKTKVPNNLGDFGTVEFCLS
ncbi:MAG: hypothetical protein FD135_2064 [Comamonadaceae bacterium]|nr:MAG: hypothetical protein FD135_2064 [Comamonadaceae bacterium]